MIKYKTGYAYNQIKKVEASKETDRSVWTNEYERGTGRHPKHSVDLNYWDTWDDAHSFLMQKIQQKTDYLRSQLIAEEKRLAEVAGMKKL